MPKRKHETLEEALARLWCYYCDREFPYHKDLSDHQRAVHFKCTYDPRSCSRKLQTASGLKVHMEQVHKAELHKVPNANPERAALEPDIFAMEGVPQHLIDKRNDAIIKEFSQAEAEHLRRTGNSLFGTNDPTKKQKVDVAAVPTDAKEKARAFKEMKRLQRQLKAEAEARGEEPPVFEAYQPTPPASVPTAAAAMGPGPSASPPAATFAASHMPPNSDSPTPYHPSLPAAPSNSYSPIPTNGNSNGNYGPMNAPYSMGSMHGSLPAPVHTGTMPAPQGMYQMTNRPAPGHDGDRFREQYPLHGLPSLPPAQATVPSVAPVHALPTAPVPAPIDATYAFLDEQKRQHDALNKSNEMSQQTTVQPDPQPNNASRTSDQSNSKSSQGTKMMIEDNFVSWEERRAENPRYRAMASKLTSF